LIWSVATPLMIVSVISFLWGLFNTPWFNYLMFRIMIRKLGYKGKTRLL
jgi:hypothetical protein